MKKQDKRLVQRNKLLLNESARHTVRVKDNKAQRMEKGRLRIKRDEIK